MHMPMSAGSTVRSSEKKNSWRPMPISFQKRPQIKHSSHKWQFTMFECHMILNLKDQWEGIISPQSHENDGGYTLYFSLMSLWSVTRNQLINQTEPSIFWVFKCRNHNHYFEISCILPYEVLDSLLLKVKFIRHVTASSKWAAKNAS